MHRNTDTTVTSGSSTKRSVYTYNDRGKPTRIVNEITQGNKITTYEDFEYNADGQLTGYWSPLANGGKGADYKTTYTYDSKYRIPLTKTYKISSGATIKEENVLTSDKANIASTNVYVNNVLSGKTVFTYDSKGKPTKIQEYYSSSAYDETTITYLTNGSVDKTTTSGVSQSFSYDAMGRVTKTVDGRGFESFVQYDKLGRPTKVINPDNTEKTTQYNDTANTVTVKDENGNSIRYEYDKLGNILRVLDTADNSVLNAFTYDNSMRMRTETDAMGTVTTVTYDSANRVLTKNVGSGLHLETYTYTDAVSTSSVKVEKVITGETDAPNQKTAVYIDKYGNTEKESVFDGTVEYSNTYKYDYIGNKIEERSAKDAKDGVTFTARYEYDHMGNVTKTTNSLSETFTTKYDWLGRAIEATDPMGSVAKTFYGGLGRVIREEIPFEDSYITKKVYTYDNNGNVLTQQASNNKPGSAETFSKTEYVYNNRNMLTRVNSYDGASVASYVEYEYDNVGNKKKLKAANGTQITAYEYDRFNRVTKLTDALGQEESYTYDKNGNLLTKTDRNGAVITNTYDGLNRLLTTTAKNPGGTQAPEFVSYKYAKTGAVLEEKNENLTTNFKYDAMGRLVSQTETGADIANKVEKSYTYDLANNRLSFILKKGRIQQIGTSYAYDRLNRLVKVTENGESTAYTYDKNGNRKSLTYPNEVTTDYTYNKANLVKTLVNKKDTAVLSGYTYSYYLDGNQEKKLEDNGRKTIYVYDGLGRLKSEAEEDPIGNTTKAYTFDTAGNRKTMTVTTSGGSLGNTVATTTYTYDLNNRLLKDSTVKGYVETANVYQYDNNGNQFSKMQEKYSTVSGEPEAMGIYAVGTGAEDDIAYELNTFNVFNQLVETVNEKASASYTYKADGLRMSKTVDGVITNHIWDGSNIVLEYDGNGGIIDIYIRGINLIKSNNQGYYVYNAHGDVTARTNSSGAVIKVYHYDAFGVEIDKYDADTNPFRYCGEYVDLETNTYYLRARYYNPNLGCFANEDPVRDGLNWYTYCNGNPVVYVDPNGMTYKLAVGYLINSNNRNWSTYDRDFNYLLYKQVSQWFSTQAIEFIKEAEGKSTTAYRGIDAYNETIGYGHVIKDGEDFGGGLTDIQMEQLLIKDLKGVYQKNLNTFLVSNNILNLEQHQYDALLSFAFNVGEYSWTKNDWDIVNFIKTGIFSDLDKIISVFTLYCKYTDGNGNKVVAPGLWRRRMNEALLFYTGVYRNYEISELNEMGYYIDDPKKK